MNISLIHPAFEAVGGAEILVATHAQFLREKQFDCQIATLNYNKSVWQEMLQGVSVKALHSSSVHGKLISMVPINLRWKSAWLDWQLKHHQRDIAIAYNHPANMLLGHSQYHGRKIWHCNEPHRYIHLMSSQPNLVAAAQNIVHFPQYGEITAVRQMVKRIHYWQKEQRQMGTHWRKRNDDLAAVAKIPELWALSEYSRDLVKATFRRHDVSVIYPLVRFPKEVFHRPGIDRSGLKILTHSRLYCEKNVDTVLRGFKLFYEKALAKPHLHIVGQGSSSEELKVLAKELSLEKVVTFHGFLPHDELERVYATCDVFALLPFDEPFGMVFPEAAARGLLLIAPNHGGPFEIVDHGSLGMAIDAFSPESFADSLHATWALSDEEVNRRREKANQVCRERFGRKVIGERFLELLGQSC